MDVSEPLGIRVQCVVVDARDPRAQARFWAYVPGSKTVKNRLHLDLRPDDQAAHVSRLVGLGATRADVGQTGDERWIVLADPEGNEFCVLPPLPLDQG